MSYSNSLLSYTWRGTDDYFLKAFRIFRQKSQQEKQIISVLQERLPSAMEETIYKSLSANQKINILSVGSGDGKMDIEILKIIYGAVRKTFPALSEFKIFVRVIEPQENHLQLYREETKSLPQEMNNAQVVFDIGKPKTLEEYCLKEKGEEDVPFDIVHIIHATYFFTDLESSLNHCFDMLADRGLIVLVLVGKDDTNALANRRFVNSSGHVGIEVARIAAKRGWKYRVYKNQYTIDVTEVFDQRSYDGGLLLDFITHIMDFRANARSEIVDEALETIRNNSTFVNGKILAKRVEETHFIFK